MIATIEHQGNQYPHFQSEGYAMQFALPFAKKVCRGYGVDIGCNREEWAFKDIEDVPALMVDPLISAEYDAYNLPPGHFDYIISSHCLEHLPDWVGALDYWTTKLKRGGTLFLYLPSYTQSYWRPWSNRKHIHVLDPLVIEQYLKDKGYAKIFVSGVDLNSSFAVMAEKVI